jgi:hypothetical protein
MTRPGLTGIAVPETTGGEGGSPADAAINTLIEQRMRRRRGSMTAGGAVEILRNRIAEAIFGRRFDQRGEPADAPR